MRCVLHLDKHNYTQLGMCMCMTHLHAAACDNVGTLDILVDRRLCLNYSPDTCWGQAWNYLLLRFSARAVERAQGQIRQPRTSFGHSLIISLALWVS